jgi:DNA-directed RNA polymerase subunit beta'
MAWTMYAPYIQRRLVVSGMNPSDALRNVRDRSQHASHALHQEVKERPVIYSRAPSWHKYNVLSGHPKIIPGSTISINPLVTTGLNADFDGDTMNLHVPSMPEAVDEAYEKLMPSKMLFSIRDQDKVVPLPKHEQLLGLYAANARPAKAVHQFRSENEALAAIQKGQIRLSDEVQILGPSTLAPTH